MTYNFDPDRWLADQVARLEMQRKAGAIDDRAFDEAMRDLERRHEAMAARLDGTYQLPPGRTVS
jgi:hypothetical protein